MKRHSYFYTIRAFIFTLILALLTQPSLKAAMQKGDYLDPEVRERMQRHQKSIETLEKRMAVENEAYRLEKAGRYQEAVELFKRAILIAGDSAAASPAHLSLERIYEKTGQYDKSLEQVEWFLKGNQNGQGRQASLADKQRLLQKIEAQKRGEKSVEPKAGADARQEQRVRNIADFQKADYGTQRKFLEKKLPEDTEIRRLSKQAMLAEHAGKFGEARESYEQLLARKDETVEIVGEFGWVMLYPAVQRTSELIGDEKREKEMLVWIRDYMMLERAPYHEEYLNGLMPDVRDHLKARLKKFALGSCAVGRYIIKSKNNLGDS